MLSENMFSRVESLIDEAQVVSFDVFDTLLFRKVNKPEDVFDLVGIKFKIPDFRKIRVEGQACASQIMAEKNNYPHANYDEIYKYIEEKYALDVDVAELKKCEISIEREMLVANPEVKKIYEYAVNAGKRVIAVTDMYLSSEVIHSLLKENGYEHIEKVYCSADERKAKFNGTLFPHVFRQEGISSDRMVHIGDNQMDDYYRPLRYGVVCFHYDSFVAQEFSDEGTIFDEGIYKILTSDSDDFWYNLGVKCGGPMYLGLYRWLEKMDFMNCSKLLCMARDGYNLFHMLEPIMGDKVDYIHTSRRALLLAGINELSETSLKELPPYTFGQTLRDIFEFLDIDTDEINYLQESGFNSLDDQILRDVDFDKVKSLLKRNEAVLLKKCAAERTELKRYLASKGALSSDVVYFDCGWNGSSQYLLERSLSALGKAADTSFLYFGIQNSEKSRRQLNNKKYEAFAFDWNRNLDIQQSVNTCALVYELFFGAPEGSTLRYHNGEPVLNDEYNDIQISISKGILDFVMMSKDYADEYQLIITPQQAISQVNRLINHPTNDEAMMIGNLISTDTFSQQKGETKYVAYMTEEQFEKNPRTDVFWMNGFLKRNDISLELKRAVAKIRGVELDADKKQYLLENYEDINRYLAWRDKQVPSDTLKEQNIFFSVVMPVYNTVTKQLRQAIDSVLSQTYKNYELILVDDCSTWENVRDDLKQYEDNARVHIIYRKSNGHISEATNDGVAASKGDFIAFMDCDDYIEPTALNEFALYLQNHPNMDFVYSDEDKVTEDGNLLHMPFFKPDWSPDLFMSEMYTNHLAVYRTEIVKKIGGLRTKCNGAQDYDMTLRFMDYSSNERVGHIAKVLYHWRERKESVAFSLDSKDYATEATRIAKSETLERRGIDGFMEYVPTVRQYRTVYNVVGTPLVSIIIPSKDNYEVLKRCVESVFVRTIYQNYEIVIVDNGSNEETQEKVRKLMSSYPGRVQYVYEVSTFNFSHMCNLGVQHAKGEYVLLLNDDTEVINGKWLERMLGHAQMNHVGAVGAKLLYPNSTTIQHAGVSLIEAGPSHHFMGNDDVYSYYFATTHLDADCIAVTGACLLVNKEKYNYVHGLDEKLPNDYNDIDFCMKMHECGFYNVVRSDAVLFHYESLSRDAENYINEERRIHALKILRENHPRISHDPYLNCNLKNKSLVLEVSEACDEIRCFDARELAGVRVVGQAHIDIINTDFGLRIIGWNSLDSDKLINMYKRRMLIVHDRHMDYSIDLHDNMRKDMVEWSGDIANINIGFSCRTNDRVKTLDWYSCDYGVLSELESGERVYTPVLRWKTDKEKSASTEMVQEEEQSVEEKKENLLGEMLTGFANVIVYGAGVYGKQCVSELLDDNIKPQAVVVSNLEGNPTDVCGVEVQAYENLDLNYKGKDTVIIVALKNAFSQEVIPMLKKDGIAAIISYTEKKMV